MDIILSDNPDDGAPLLVMGDMNICLDKMQAEEFFLSSFETGFFPSCTQRGGKLLYLVLTRNCSAVDLTVTLLHLSGCFLVKSSATFLHSQALSQMVSFCRNLKSVMVVQLCEEVKSAMSEC